LQRNPLCYHIRPLRRRGPRDRVRGEKPRHEKGVHAHAHEPPPISVCFFAYRSDAPHMFCFFQAEKAKAEKAVAKDKVKIPFCGIESVHDKAFLCFVFFTHYTTKNRICKYFLQMLKNKKKKN
jgi:hypothetical protein